MTDPHSPLDLVRRYEPVLRYTAGELFFPMPVHDYLAHASLWMTVPQAKPVLVLDQGKLDADRLAEAARDHPDAALFLRFAPASLSRDALRAWRKRPDRPSFYGVSRLAAVGLLGRFIDTLMRLSLTVRGKVPGGLAAASQQQYAKIAPPRDAYHAHVSSDGGYVVIQYWFLYAMNDWRSQLQRRQRPRGGLGAGHHLPGPGRRRQSGADVDRVLLARRHRRRAAAASRRPGHHLERHPSGGERGRRLALGRLPAWRLSGTRTAAGGRPRCSRW